MSRRESFLNKYQNNNHHLTKIWGKNHENGENRENGFVKEKLHYSIFLFLSQVKKLLLDLKKTCCKLSRKGSNERYQ